MSRRTILDVKVTFPLPQGGREVHVVSAVSDTGAQVNIFPAKLIRDSGLHLCGVTSNKLPKIKSASGTRVTVTGAVNVRMSAINGECFTTSTKVFIADVDNFYLSFNALKD